MTTALLVALGAAVGAAGRHLTNHWLRERFGATPAGGTLAVNLLGSFVLGVLAVRSAWLAGVRQGGETASTMPEGPTLLVFAETYVMHREAGGWRIAGVANSRQTR